MRVTVGITVPNDAAVTVTIAAKIEDLLALRKQIESGSGWSKTGEVLSAAIAGASSRLLATVQQEVTQTPENT